MSSIFKQETLLNGHQLSEKFHGGSHFRLEDESVRALVVSKDGKHYAYVNEDGELQERAVTLATGIEIEGELFNVQSLEGESFNLERGLGLIPSRVEIKDHTRFTQAGLFVRRGDHESS
ncbi:MAG: hypothetical protein KDD62_13470 [Bdellovibrionales bacterium]|nr:hypothetical protein [Bdellovibrionales bacterium]